jgi:serine/threonine-protein kinase
VTATQQFGKYTLLANIAQGGMAEVVLAKMHGAAGFEKLVVIKRLLDKLAADKQYVDMFLDEAKIAARLSHSNIVQVLELGEVDGQYFIAMEFLAGLNVSTLAKKAQARLGGMPQDLAAQLVEQTSAGLHYAHERRLPDGRPLDIIHRDVSPHNLVVTYEGLVKIVDFGIAKAADRMTKTASGMIKGKFAYMSPEQARNEELDRRSDVYALGIVFWECLTGRRLFRRESTYKTYEAIMSGEVPPPSTLRPGIDHEFDRIALKALQRNRDKRYQTAEAMQDDLDEVMHRRAAMGTCEILTRTDVETYLEKHFGGEIRNQREFLAKVGRGDVTGQAPAAEAYPPLADDAVEEAATKVFEQPEDGAGAPPKPGMHATAPAPDDRERVQVSGDIVAVPVAPQEDVQSSPTIIDPPIEESSPILPSPPRPPPPPPPPPRAPTPRPPSTSSKSSMPPYQKPPEQMVITDRIERPVQYVDLRPKSYWWFWLLLAIAAGTLAWWISRS